MLEEQPFMNQQTMFCFHIQDQFAKEKDFLYLRSARLTDGQGCRVHISDYLKKINGEMIFQSTDDKVGIIFRSCDLVM